MKYDKFNRRLFLQGAGSFVLAVPFLPSLLSKAEAAADLPPKRFVAAWNPLSHYMSNYWPAQDPKTAFSNDVLYASLTNSTQDISPTFTAARFNSVRSKMLLLRGLDSMGPQGHNDTVMLSASNVFQGSPPWTTIDNVIAKSNVVYPTSPYTRTLNLRPDGSGDKVGYRGFSYDFVGGNYGYTPSIYNENAAFSKLFGGNAKATNPSHGVNQIKVVDRVLQDFMRIRNSSSIGSADRQSLDNYIGHMNDLENRLKGTGNSLGATCSMPNLTTSGVDSGAWDIRKAYKNHIDILVAALACRLTNVATLQMYDNAIFDYGYTHDPMSHSGSQTDDPVLGPQDLQVLGWYADQMAYLVTKMDAIAESNGTLLDNSLVMWGGEIGCSNGSLHQLQSMPTAMWGGLQGYLKTGYYVDYRQNPRLYQFDSVKFDEANGRLYNQLLVTVMQGMGLAPGEYEQPGIPGYGNYIPGPPQYGRDNTVYYGNYFDTGTRRSPLPFIKA